MGAWRVLLLTTLVMGLVSACPAPAPALRPATPAPATPAATTSTPPAPVGGAVSGLLVRMNPQELASQSSNIVVGRVTETRSEWNADRSRIRTLVTLALEQSVKGSIAGNTLVIEVPGGTVGTVSEAVEDTPGFSTGERVLVFLQAQGNSFSVVGGFQGKRAIDSNGNIAGTGTSVAEFIQQVRGEPGQPAREKR